MDDFSLRLDLAEALGLWLALRDREHDEDLAGILARLRSHLYDRLSIEEMESPEATLSLLRRTGSLPKGRS